PVGLRLPKPRVSKLAVDLKFPDVEGSGREPEMRLTTVGVTGILLALGLALSMRSASADSESPAREAYVHVPMPPGFKVVSTELEGPVFADSRGRTLYTWPIKSLRNGYAGDPKDKSACGDVVTT